ASRAKNGMDLLVERGDGDTIVGSEQLGEASGGPLGSVERWAAHRARAVEHERYVDRRAAGRLIGSYSNEETDLVRVLGGAEFDRELDFRAHSGVPPGLSEWYSTPVTVSPIGCEDLFADIQARDRAASRDEFAAGRMLVE